VPVGGDRRRPARKDLFHLDIVAIETACLLLSSFTCGVAAIGARAQSNLLFHRQHGADRAARRGFLGVELNEFAGMIAIGAGPTRSAFLSSFLPWSAATDCMSRFGLMWLLNDDGAGPRQGYRPDILRRVLCFSMFWHTLDIIWGSRSSPWSI